MALRPFMQAATNYLRETRSELKKVAWPTREQTMQYTLVVIGVSAAVMVFLGGLDYLFTRIMDALVFARV